MQNQTIVLLSGEISAGKTTLATSLVKKFGFKVLKTKEILITLSKTRERVNLQDFGDKLDRQTDGRWVLENFMSHVYQEHHPFFLIDSVRILPQIKWFRSAFGWRVVHVHLHAGADDLQRRFNQRKVGKGSIDTKTSYEKVKANKTEQSVQILRESADILLDTSRCTPEDVLIKVAAMLGILSPPSSRLVDVLVGAQFGSEGKGQIAGYLAPEYDALVRVGGPNAGHSVYEEPAPHKFHMLPSGSSRNQNAKIIIGPGAVINLKKLLDEIRCFSITTDRLIIDENVTVISENDIRAEGGVKAKIGSTGQGVGVATARNILNRGMNKRNKAKFFLKELRGYLGSSHDTLEEIYRKGGKVLLEGTQGTALSLYHGIYPYVTSRDTTVSGCLAEAGIGPGRVDRIIMVTRTHPIRVQNPEDGTSGPFGLNETQWGSSELTWSAISKLSDIPRKDLVKAEKTTTTNRRRRVAEFSWDFFRKACELNSPTDIALTFADYLSISNRKARRFDQLTPQTILKIEELEKCAGVPVSLISTRFDFRCIIDCRNWWYR